MILLKQRDACHHALEASSNMDGSKARCSLTVSTKLESDSKKLILQGNDCVKRNEFDKAIQFYEEAISQKKLTTKQELVEVCSILNNIGIVYRKKGANEKALATYEESLQIKKTLFGPKSIELIATINNIGTVHYNSNNHKTALRCYDEALALTRLHLGKDTLQEARTLSNVAWVHVMRESLNDAVDSFSEALRIFRANRVPESDMSIRGTLHGMQETRLRLEKAA